MDIPTVSLYQHFAKADDRKKQKNWLKNTKSPTKSMQHGRDGKRDADAEKDGRMMNAGLRGKGCPAGHRRKNPKRNLLWLP